ncbi:glycosyl transferase [Clostridium botulinum]|uniref:CDP-glycerol glycerophosphotransferase family protein n=1 Tax=Clostridium botulinum TaxID=1491 RepID=UPI000174E24A|nr:CDP-glycerol glycerophosphotransferase family protein [Clostridium botulinum]ACD53410.1 glycosyl transferase, group 2 family protein [Clostridium botulinum E3 str. Alaska E43]AJF30801.1 glycosyl transferase [Clostridium botulinum]AJF33864.1 glycosyl transferase [Clostridium botulinum]MBN1036683.1 glycosyl transferase [Clostridium botulinum]MBY6787971.1 CDP-glycerol glycerophosphotransferase family protein [Clostridium botulinum]
MKKVKYIIKKVLKSVIIIIFNIMKLLPLKNDFVVLDSWKGQYLKGNLLSIYNELNLNYNLKIVVIGNNFNFKNSNTVVCKSKSIKHIYYLAISKYWIVDTLYYDYLKPRKETKYILVWHAPGVFKRFGISTINGCKTLEEVYIKNGRNLSNLIVSSPIVKQIYSKELCIDENKIISLGLPRTDEFILQCESCKENIYAKYGINKEKKIILYAPTFRGEGIKDFNLNLDIDKIDIYMNLDYIIIVKLHPNNYIEKTSTSWLNSKIIISEGDNLEELMKVSDCLITDYSSIIFEYCLLKKPIFFYAYDLENYMHNERGFYIDYEEFVPGPIVYNTEQLINEINNYQIDKYKDKINYVANEYQRHDGKCTKRFMEYFFNNRKRLR